MKYVMLKIESGDMAQELPFIFPNQLVHSDIAAALESVPGMEGAKVVAAGECHVQSKCSGRSTTMNLSSRGKRDSENINTIDYCHGLVEE